MLRSAFNLLFLMAFFLDVLVLDKGFRLKFSAITEFCANLLLSVLHCIFGKMCELAARGLPELSERPPAILVLCCTVYLTGHTQVTTVRH